jgi:hypothetical protein
MGMVGSSPTNGLMLKASLLPDGARSIPLAATETQFVPYTAYPICMFCKWLVDVLKEIFFSSDGFSLVFTFLNLQR